MHFILKDITLIVTLCPFTLLKSKCPLFFTKLIKILILRKNV